LYISVSRTKWDTEELSDITMKRKSSDDRLPVTGITHLSTDIQNWRCILLFRKIYGDKSEKKIEVLRSQKQY
jgi:hypothetical protein